jgi:hypothetical protein
MRPPQLADQRLGLRREPAGDIRGRRVASRSPSSPAAACRAFQEYADCRDTPYGPLPR